jgi:carboxypeptidase Taq
MDFAAAYDWLAKDAEKRRIIGSMGSLLHWDQSICIPDAGREHRAEQMAALAGLMHGMNANPEIGEKLSDCEDRISEADPAQAANLREWRRDFDRESKIPEDLARALARAASRGESAWQKARPENDWDSFLPHLRELVGLRLEEAEAVGYENEPYDALLDEYEPGMTAAELAPVFNGLRKSLTALLDRIRGSSRSPDTKILAGSYPKAAQEEFCREAARAIGFDFDAGRLDVSAHPFTTRIGPGDTRITTRYDENDFAQAFFGAIHETGHALYAQGLPAEHYGSPLGESASLGVHESQSRLWENGVARSRGFWKRFYPAAQKRFDALSDVSPDEFHFAVNMVRPDLIRVEADEVTYNLHVALRFELELALTRGELEPADLPGAWNEKMRDYLGIVPGDHASGVMQDVHWAAGMIGYFPTYTLGNLYAAQILEAVRDELGELGEMFERGEFGRLLSWLRDRIHSKGRMYEPAELMRRATGRELRSDELTRRLETKYGGLYGV